MARMSNDELWRRIFSQRVVEVHAERWILGRIPSEPRCSWCRAPFGGLGGTVLRKVFRRGRSNYNPAICSVCDNYFKTHPGGAEIELTLLFVDVRGSSDLAKQMSPTEFSRLMDRFYTVAAAVVGRTNGLIEKFVGDEVAILYVPGFTGPNHARTAVHAAQQMLVATGHEDPAGPWLRVGAGVHTGVAFVGSVGSGGVSQLTVLGDLPNVTARLASLAGAGEILVSDAAQAHGGLRREEGAFRQVPLKGRSAPLDVAVIRVDSEVNVDGPSTTEHRP
jgi:adenylate cyclase